MASRGLADGEIQQSPFEYEDSEDGFDGDDDNIADPDFVPDLEVPMEVDDLEEVGEVDIDTIIHNIENYVSTSQLPVPYETLSQPEPSSRPVPPGRNQAKQK